MKFFPASAMTNTPFWIFSQICSEFMLLLFKKQAQMTCFYNPNRPYFVSWLLFLKSPEITYGHPGKIPPKKSAYSERQNDGDLNREMRLEERVQKVFKKFPVTRTGGQRGVFKHPAKKYLACQQLQYRHQNDNLGQHQRHDPPQKPDTVDFKKYSIRHIKSALKDLNKRLALKSLILRAVMEIFRSEEHTSELQS